MRIWTRTKRNEEVHPNKIWSLFYDSFEPLIRYDMLSGQSSISVHFIYLSHSSVFWLWITTIQCFLFFFELRFSFWHELNKQIILTRRKSAANIMSLCMWTSTCNFNFNWHSTEMCIADACTWILRKHFFITESDFRGVNMINMKIKFKINPFHFRPSNLIFQSSKCQLNYFRSCYVLAKKKQKITR